MVRSVQAIDFDAGFNAVFAAAYKLPDGTSVKDKFGSEFGAHLTHVSCSVGRVLLRANEQAQLSSTVPCQGR